jgi:hypothetical protein
MEALSYAIQAAFAILVSHTLCVSIVMYYDLTGKWAKYAIARTRDVSVEDYMRGWWNFCFDLAFLFLPFMTLCFWHSADTIKGSKDSLAVALLKLSFGYVFGKIWAFAVHYALHFPSIYWIHRRHHQSPKKLVASSAWMDSMVEYTIMELPSFGFCVLLFPTHLPFHLMHFALHGWDGACGHSGFKAPGVLGFFFDGSYHYEHHAHLTVNYAELEFLDKLFGTHHTQKGKAL